MKNINLKYQTENLRKCNNYKNLEIKDRPLCKKERK